MSRGDNANREKTDETWLLDDSVAAAERSLKEGQVGRIEGEDAVGNSQENDHSQTEAV